MCMNRRVVMTGLGVVSPVGNTKSEFWDALLQGKSGAGILSCLDPAQFTSKMAAEVKDFDPSKHFSPKEIRHTDRFVLFAMVAAKEAIGDSGIDLDKVNKERVGVLVGSGIGGLHTIEEQHSVYLKKGASRISPFMIPMLIVNMASGQISISFGLKGPNSCVATACATGNHAIGDALRIIQRDEADMMITGGSDGCITPMGFGGFCACKALSKRNHDPQGASRPFDKERDGFVMAEGAGIVVLEEYEHAKKRNANIYCEVVGYGMSADAWHITAPDPEGKGALRCMEASVSDAELNPEEIDYINAHGTSTPLNDKVETMALKMFFKEHAKKLMVSSIKSMTGHLLGAAGGVEAISSALTIKEGIIPPTINYQHPDPDCDLDYCPNTARKKKVRVALSNSLGFGGHNATIILKKV